MGKSESAQARLFVTGAGGKIGRLLRLLWPDAHVVWLSRGDWDMGRGPAPFGPGATVLHLAGVTPGGDLSGNARAARALRDAAPGRVVLISSIAVHGPQAGALTEATPPAPASPYGAAKREVEEILAPLAPVVLRLGNLFGADALSAAARRGPVTLDRHGTGAPLRSWIGPLTFARCLRSLVESAPPGVLNLAQPPALGMDAILDAMGVAWHYGPNPAPWPRAELDASRLGLPDATPAGLVAELASLQGRWP